MKTNTHETFAFKMQFQSYISSIKIFAIAQSMLQGIGFQSYISRLKQFNAKVTDDINDEFRILLLVRLNHMGNRGGVVGGMQFQSYISLIKTVKVSSETKSHEIISILL